MLKNTQKLSIEDFTTVSVIGKGSYAKVILVKKLESGKLYAMKILKKEKVEKKKQEKNVVVERNILANVNHPFVIEFFASFQNKRKLFFVLQYCPGKSPIFKRRKIN